MENYLMLFILLIILLIVMRQDSALLRKWSPALCDDLMKVSARTATLVLVTFAVVVFLADELIRGIVIGFVILILPLYLSLRHEILNQINQKNVVVPENEVIVSDSYAVILYWLFGIGVISVLVGLIFSLLNYDQENLWIALIGTFLSFVWMVFLISLASCKFSQLSFWHNLSFIRPKKGMAKIVLTSIVLALMFGCASAYIILHRQVQPETPLSKLLEENESISAVAFFILLALMIAPLAEELIFRGYFFHVLEKSKGRAIAVIVIALAFAGLHVGQYWGDWLAIVMITLLGFTLTLLRAWSKTTIASTIMHYVYNSTVTIIPIIVLILSNPAYFKDAKAYPILNVKEKEALLLYRIKTKPDFDQSYNDLAWLYASQDQNLNQALQLVDQALLISPDQPEYLDTKAEVLFKLKDYQEALKISNRILGSAKDEKIKSMQIERIKAINQQFKVHANN